MKVYVISGGPGVGKTSVLNELGKQGHNALSESAREVSLKDKRFVGKSIKQINMKHFQDAIFCEQKKVLRELKKGEIYFSDRGLGDTLAYYAINNLKSFKELEDYAKKFRYEKVFILDVLDFYEQDDLRQESREEQIEIHKIILQAYQDLGYEPVIVPFMSNEKRVEFVLKEIKVKFK